MLMRIATSILSLLFIVSLSACGGPGGESESGNAKPAKKIFLAIGTGAQSGVYYLTGVNIADEVASTLAEIATASGKVNDLVAEIAAASREQSQGIDQVNTAVTQMDKVTQQNAANAEESASASEELNAQAAQMNTVVTELSVLVGGASHNVLTNTGGARLHTAAPKAHTTTGTATTKDSATSYKELIPLDDKEAVTASAEFNEFSS